jgi:CRISPR system Cascade subunit CasE
MYLTRAYLNPRRDGAQRLLASPQRMHAATLACFPDQPVPQPSGDGRVLWRLDHDKPHRPVLWVVSPARPDLTHVIETAGWPRAETPQWESRPYEPLLERLANGQQYAFRLTANPTKSIKSDPASTEQVQAAGTSRPRSKRVPHVTVEYQLEWLDRRSEHAGFRLLPASAVLPGSGEHATQAEIRDRATSRFRKSDADRPVAIARTTYVGALEITDHERLRQVLCQGLGHARAYGCGLLTLAGLHAWRRG